MKKSNIFWGILFISVGILWILSSLSIISISICSLMKLCPIIFIWIGISCIPMKDFWKILANCIVLAIGILLLLHISGNDIFCHRAKCSPYEETISTRIPIISNKEDSILLKDQATLHFQSDAVKSQFMLNDSSLVDVLNRNGNLTTQYAISNKTEDNGSDIDLKISAVENNSHFPSADIALSNHPVWNLDIELNASNCNLDLQNYKIKELEISADASHFDLKIGKLQKNVNILLDLEASAAKIAIPQEMKCTITRKSNLTPLNIKGFEKMKDNSYVSKNHDSIEGFINIQLESDVSAIDITRY